MKSLNIKKHKKTLQFSASVQHMNNVNMMVLCDECDMWRLLYCKTKLLKNSVLCLSHYWITILIHVAQDIELSVPFKEVYVRNISCYEPIEKLYYSARYDPICIYCAEEVIVQDANAEFFPQCTHCSKPKIKVAS